MLSYGFTVLLGSGNTTWRVGAAAHRGVPGGKGGGGGTAQLLALERDVRGRRGQQRQAELRSEMVPAPPTK